MSACLCSLVPRLRSGLPSLSPGGRHQQQDLSDPVQERGGGGERRSPLQSHDAVGREEGMHRKGRGGAPASSSILSFHFLKE